MSRILVVDDDDNFRWAITQTLRRAGCEVLSAADGAAALQLYQEHPVDLVITDLIMPGKEGLETIMELRRLRHDLKIIAMSGGGHVGPEDYLSVAAQLGATITLSKPFSAQELLETVKGLLHEPGNLATADTRIPSLHQQD
jgi:DNA-binding response OmpR family regulator